MESVGNLKKFERTGILVVLLISSFITAMSTTVTGNMIPNLMVYFNVSSSAAQWLTSGATLLSGIIIPITAFLIKKVPNKNYYLLAMFAFTLGSLGAFTAGNFVILLVSRMVQALGCGMMLSFAQVIILTIYPKEQHGTMMAAYSMAASVSSMVGPTYAGLLMDYVGWRGVFVSLFIVGAVLLVLGFIFMRNVTPKQGAYVNSLYVAVSSAGFATLIIGLNNMKNGALHLTSGGIMLIGIILIVIFAVMQLKSDKPMLNLKVFKSSSFTLGVLITICLYLISMGNAVILPILAKIECGFSDTAYGLSTLVGAGISVFATLFAGKIYDKVGIKPMTIVTIIGFAMSSICGYMSTSSSSIVWIGLIYAMQTIAMSTLISPVTTMALSNLNQQLRVDGSSIFNTLRQISSSIATTVAVLLLTLFGDDLAAIHSVYVYFGVVTAVIIFLVVFFIWRKKPAN
ncbi:MAG: MFS transporter [Lachnospiraceae bacterium]|nr:MFS transporter [Lachnospiraceae bacterium]